MTFLEYFCHHMLGPPTGASGDATNWECPQCESESAFACLPHLPQYKDRVKCLRCGFWGDEFDVLVVCVPRIKYPDRQCYIEKVRRTYDALPLDQQTGHEINEWRVMTALLKRNDKEERRITEVIIGLPTDREWAVMTEDERDGWYWENLEMVCRRMKFQTDDEFLRSEGVRV